LIDAPGTYGAFNARKKGVSNFWQDMLLDISSVGFMVRVLGEGMDVHAPWLVA